MVVSNLVPSEGNVRINFDSMISITHAYLGTDDVLSATNRNLVPAGCVCMYFQKRHSYEGSVCPGRGIC